MMMNRNSTDMRYDIRQWKQRNHGDVLMMRNDQTVENNLILIIKK